MKRPCLPLPAVQAPNHENITHEYFVPPKITRYTVSMARSSTFLQVGVGVVLISSLSLPSFFLCSSNLSRILSY